MKLNDFEDYYKLEKGQISPDDFANKRLTLEELKSVRKTIETLEQKGLPSSRIITALQKMNTKLGERWKSERVYWTESKRKDTKLIGEAGEDLAIKRYKCIPSPNACEICLAKSEGGKKRFSNADINKSGYGNVPPFHPNCYCIFIPD